MRILGVPKPAEPAHEPSVYLLARVYLAGDYAGSVEELPDGGYDNLRAANATAASLNSANGFGPTTVVAVMFRREWDGLAETPGLEPAKK